MPDYPRLTYWDSCVFLNYLNGNQDRLPQLEAILYEVSANENRKIVTSALTIVEVAWVCHGDKRHLDAQVEHLIDKLWAEPSIEIVELHDYIAFEARSLMRQAMMNEVGLRPADATQLASAKYVQAEVFHTYDKRLLKFNGYIGIDICEPVADNPLLL